MSKKMYKKGRLVVDMLDFGALVAQDARFIKDDPSLKVFEQRHPRMSQAQTAGFMRAQQYWVIERLVANHYLYVAERIAEPAKEQ